ncbi:DinB family protein [Peribacillus deserti]|uniref:DinB-like domain-containing protein n=1 Tax=Peribacillus deserti TaxID=673318 RepID=A0A2N5M3Y9_9BACI|nr:hypothetical protein [Peribacillus deserti]PLT29003.1 hypothetical protein CUU66_15220 [Peribacillus deserti]
MRNILEEYTRITDFFEQLKTTPEKLFFLAIGENKWSSAAIVAHFIYWDRYILESRLPGMLEGRDLEKSSVHVEEMNDRAKHYAHSGVSKEHLLDEAISWRMKSAQLLKDADFNKSFRIGEKPLTLKQFIEGDIEHDRHHMRQMEEHIKRNL